LRFAEETNPSSLQELDVAWQTHETHDGPSFWGHERLYVEPERRARLREMRPSAAARGVGRGIVSDCPLARCNHRK